MSIFDFFNKKPREFKPDELLPFIASAPGEKSISLKSLDIRVAVSGLYAETAQTMTFFNPNNRDLEGELSFPLPDNAGVCGYALDINGQMVDGVVVPKEEARQILETEIRRGVDPGLVEHVQGNIYRSRIYPIPARGSRTIRINYVSDLVVNDSEAAYHLPLRHAEFIDNVKIRIEVFQNKITPELSGLGNLTLNRWEDRWVAETELKVNESDDLLIRLPHLPDLMQTVEQHGEDFFFNISARLSGHQSNEWHPKHIGIAWDASGSHQNVQTDLKLLEQLADRWNGVKVDLLVFRNVSEAIKQFDDLNALINYLKEIPYDGGTNLTGADFGQFTDNNIEACLLFSDGLNNIERGLPERSEKPVISINSQSRHDHTYLEYITGQSGGLHLDLIRTPVNSAIEQLINFGTKMRIESADGGESLHISTGQGRLNILGRLTADQAELKLTGPGAPQHSLILKKTESSAGKLNARAWAQKESTKIALMDKYSKDLAELGRRFGLVTPGTSLLVLESLEQYLEYKIEPPRSLARMRDQYHQKIAELDRENSQTKQTQISNVLGLWTRRKAWWETDFKSAYVAENTKLKKSALPENNNLQTEAGAFYSAESFASTSMPQQSSFSNSFNTSEIAEGSSAPMAATYASMDYMEEQPGGAPQPTVAKISIQAWTPETPYLVKMRAVERAKTYEEYLTQRKDYQQSPSFFLDCGDYFFSLGQTDLALRVLSNLLELQLDDIPLLRIYGWRLQQAGELNAAISIFERIRKIRADEPQSHRDLALALGERWLLTENTDDALQSMRLLYDVISQSWDRFPEIEIIALMEMNRLIHFAAQKGIEIPDYIDQRLIRNLDLDVRISMSWDADLTDVDLHVFEPDEGHAYYGHNQTRIGGLVSKDFTRGYGPEEYVLHHAMPGKYLIKTHYYGSHQQSLSGPCTITATVFTNFGRSDESKQVLTLRLEKASNQEMVGEIFIEGNSWLELPSESVGLNKFKSLTIGMTIDEIKELLGNPDNIRGEDHIILVYQSGEDCVELHLSPRLSAVKQILPGAELNLLT